MQQIECKKGLRDENREIDKEKDKNKDKDKDRNKIDIGIQPKKNESSSSSSNKIVLSKSSNTITNQSLFHTINDSDKFLMDPMINVYYYILNEYLIKLDLG